MGAGSDLRTITQLNIVTYDMYHTIGVSYIYIYTQIYVCVKQHQKSDVGTCANRKQFHIYFGLSHERPLGDLRS